jgi:hypothetical protein
MCAGCDVDALMLNDKKFREPRLFLPIRHRLHLPSRQLTITWHARNGPSICRIQYDVKTLRYVVTNARSRAPAQKQPRCAVRYKESALLLLTVWYQTPSLRIERQSRPVERRFVIPALQSACCSSRRFMQSHARKSKIIRSWISSGRQNDTLGEYGLGCLRSSRVSPSPWFHQPSSLCQALVVLSVLAVHTVPATRRPGRGGEALRCSLSRGLCI